MRTCHIKITKAERTGFARAPMKLVRRPLGKPIWIGLIKNIDKVNFLQYNVKQIGGKAHWLPTKFIMECE